MNGYTLPFMSAVPQIYYKAQCQLALHSVGQVCTINPIFSFKKITAVCAIILCLVFMANVWKALITTHFSVRLAFFSGIFLFCFSSMVDQRVLTIRK